ncbi:sugar phosphate isomerase/epimerase family protein [Kribbella sp. GL6]|uniref:sugar phosphate isomerase/epimerase family protein n=1 Tax=Kribbella sp. GL6 TaxID=3419765 RepID=UPI003D019E00
MRLGIDGKKIPEADKRGPIGSLQHAAELGMDGIFFRTVLDLSPDLDPGLLAEIRQQADRADLYLETGLGKVNPFANPETPELRALGNGDIVLGFRRMMEACAAIGCTELWVGTANYKRAYRGKLAYDRFRTDVSWTEQLKATADFLKILAPIAIDLGLHLNVETHEEITSFEVVRLVETVGPEAVGITFDTGNVLQRIEHPVRAAERVAPYVRQTHVKDAALVHVPGGIGYQMRPVGTGAIDFASILPILNAANPNLNLTLETDRSHADNPPGTPELNMLIELDDQGFLDGHPDLTVSELSEYLRMVRDYERRVRDGEVPTLDEYRAQPYGFDEAIVFINRSRDHVRSLCAAQGIPLTPTTAAL